MQSIDELIIKFLNDSLSQQESDKLTQWAAKSDTNSAYLKNFIKSEYLLLSAINSAEAPPILEKSNTFNSITDPRPHRIKWSFIAAVFVGLILIASLFFLLKPTSSAVPEFKLDSVVIQLENGVVKPIGALDKKNQIHIDQKNRQVAYQQSKKVTEDELVYHRLTVPPGRRFKVKLSDGTLVYLNSDSKLRYPKQFSSTGTRDVYLEGEGYFEVNHDPDHPFVVHTTPLKIKVRGTKFNHSSYDNDSIIKTTLTEGKVTVWRTNDNIHPYILKPMEAVIYNRNQKSLVKDTSDLVLDLSWIENKLIFNEESFLEISKKIERYYGVKINNRYKELNQIRFSGEFNLKEETILDVLNIFQLSKPFTYHITDKEILITKNQ